MANMSDDLKQILLTDVPDFLDGWVLKSSTPCGGLIHHVDMNPFNSSKMIVWTKGQDNAEKIASVLDGYNLYGSVIRARHAFMKPPETPKAMTSSSTMDGIQAKLENKFDEKTVGGDFGSWLRPHQTTQNQPARVDLQHKDEKLHRDRKRRSSATANSTEVLEDAQRGESAGRSSKKSSKGSSRSKDSKSRHSPDSKKHKNASRWCRFCLRSGHETWLCTSNAEYYKVGLTARGKNPTGCQWPVSSVVKVEGLCAGPIIEYIEKFHLQMEEMNREEMRIMFAWLTNFFLCHNCGAVGHLDTMNLCKYLPLEYPVTEEMIHHFRKPFCRRMKGIREKVSFGKLQRYASDWNNKFRVLMKIEDVQPFHSDRREEEHSERRHQDPFAEPTNPERDRPRTFGPIGRVSDVKRIKRERRSDRDRSQDAD